MSSVGLNLASMCVSVANMMCGNRSERVHGIIISHLFSIDLMLRQLITNDLIGVPASWLSKFWPYALDLFELKVSE